MSFLKNLFEFMEAASIAHAKWDYEVSMNILHKKKRFLILGGVAATWIISRRDRGQCL